jgi:hypothetical protein
MGAFPVACAWSRPASGGRADGPITEETLRDRIPFGRVGVGGRVDELLHELSPAIADI